MMNLILLGAPGAGKGTQGSQLAHRLGVVKIATGDILRVAVREGTELGSRAKRFMDAGELVPDDVILGLVREALVDESARNGVIFDGFPRNVAQAEALASILQDSEKSLDGVVVLEVPDEAIVERMSGRRTDPVTGDVYHITHMPPPADIAARVVQRLDDQTDTVRHRLAVYAAQTAPLIEHYERTGVPVYRVNGTGTIEDVQAQVLTSIAAE